MHIRPATPSDAETVREVAAESWHAAYDDFLGADAVAETVAEWYAVEGLERAIADAADSEDAVFLVAETDDGEDVGFAHAGPSHTDPDHATLSRIYVRPERWDDGIGSAMIDRVESALVDEYDRLELEVFAANEVGVSFYESLGFERVDEVHQEFGGEEQLVYIYELPLEADDQE